MKFTCNDCPLRANCTRPCAAVQALLPSVDRGALSGMDRSGALRNARRLRALMHESRFFTDYRDRLKGRQKLVFNLTYNEGLSQREIAKVLGLHPRSVGYILARARRNIARFASHRRGSARRKRG